MVESLTTEEQDIPQTSPEDDAALAEWHQKRFMEANKPKRTNADILREIANDPKRKSYFNPDGTRKRS